MKTSIHSWLKTAGFAFNRAEHFHFQRIGRVRFVVVVHIFGTEDAGTVGAYRGLRARGQVVCRKDLSIDGHLWVDYDESNKQQVFEEVCRAIERETALALLSWSELLLQATNEATSCECRQVFEDEHAARV